MRMGGNGNLKIHFGHTAKSSFSAEKLLVYPFSGSQWTTSHSVECRKQSVINPTAITDRNRVHFMKAMTRSLRENFHMCLPRNVVKRGICENNKGAIHYCRAACSAVWSRESCPVSVCPCVRLSNAWIVTKHIKSHFAWRKSATKFLCVKTVNDKVVRHSLVYLSVRKWLAGNVPFYVKIWQILTHPLAKRRFFSISSLEAPQM